MCEIGIMGGRILGAHRVCTRCEHYKDDDKFYFKDPDDSRRGVCFLCVTPTDTLLRLSDESSKRKERRQEHKRKCQELQAQIAAELTKPLFGEFPPEPERAHVRVEVKRYLLAWPAQNGRFVKPSGRD